MEPFPKEKLVEPLEIKVLSIDLNLFCCCSVQDVKGLGLWIACDVHYPWYLQRCEKFQEVSE